MCPNDHLAQSNVCCHLTTLTHAHPANRVHNTKREDLTFIGFQLWVFGMSIVAILNESIPHTLAALATHVLATAWSGYQLVNTASFQSEFVRSTIRSGLCGGGSVNLLPTYWVERRAAEVSVLVVNAVSLLISGALSWRLVKVRSLESGLLVPMLNCSRCLDGRHSSVSVPRWRSTASTKLCSPFPSACRSRSSSSVRSTQLDCLLLAEHQ